MLFTKEQKHRNTANDPNEKLILLIHACDFAFDNGVGLMVYYTINHMQPFRSLEVD